MNDSNSIIIEAWNTILFDKFVRFRHLLVDGLSQHSDAALLRHPYPQGAHVLDVGCGFGDSTLRIAQRVGPAGSATGVDCAENFIRAAQQDAQDNGVQNANFQIRDVEWDDLGGPYDHAFARFGTMFFAMPGAAMRNICRALKPGGTFTQIVWRKREDNPWLHEAELRVKAIVPVVSHEDTDQVHCGPGPFSMAGADMVSDMLGGAGFSNITLERHDCDSASAAIWTTPSPSPWRWGLQARSFASPANRARHARTRSSQRCVKPSLLMPGTTACGPLQAPGSSAPRPTENMVRSESPFRPPPIKSNTQAQKSPAHGRAFSSQVEQDQRT